MASSLVMLGLWPIVASALPEGGVVTQGDATITVQGTTMTIDQASGLAAINWDGFSIGAGETVDIQQLGLDAALLNRVTGADPSVLLGQLSATGRVYVINPNGVLVGPDAHINTQAFIASALDVADQDFLDGGDLKFTGNSVEPVVNLGHITAANGDAILIAQVVRNAGEIHAPEGTAALAAGSEVLYQPDADQRVVIAHAIDERVAETGVENTGLVAAAEAELKAAGGNVYALAINQSGVVRATGVEHRDGRVLLTSAGGDIKIDGSIAAHDADGAGGEILVGGDFRGENPAIANAANVEVTVDSHLNVAAQGDVVSGGRAIVWADEQTDFAGTIAGQGGELGGDGAFVEVSGKRILNYAGTADLTAAHGETGTLWLDPANAVISSAPDDQGNGVFNAGVLETNLATANVVVDASGYGDAFNDDGHVIVNSAVSWTSGNTLTLRAESQVQVNANLTGTGGHIVFQAGGATLDSGASITADSLTIGQNAFATFPGFNPPPLNTRTLGSVLLSGVVDVGTLDLLVENAGISEPVTIDNASNDIDILTSSVSAGTINGDLTIRDGAGDLTITGDFSNFGFGGGPTISTAGDLTLSPGTVVGSGTNADVVLASTSGSFINQAGATAVAPGAGGRYLIYSDDPANTTKGGLTGLPVYDKGFGTDAPGTITQTGSRFLYTLAPTLTFTADSLNRGENTANPALTFTVSGLVGGDTEAQAFAGLPSLLTSAMTSSAPGDYAITISTGTVVATDLGYQLNFVGGTLTIDPSKILIVKADDFNRFYGDANPAFTSSFSGFVGDDDDSLFNGFAISYTTAAIVTSPVGTYAIIPSGATTLSDYAVTYQNGTLTIDPRLLTITADHQAMTFLDSDPAFTASYSGLASFDTANDVPGLTFSVSSPNRTVGDYTITPSGAASPNYNITFVPGTLTVNPLPVTVTALDFTRLYGAANPAFSAFTVGQHSGHVVDLAGLVFTTAATASSDVGGYAITPSGMTNPNYAITYVPGTLTINPAPLTITANDFTRVYGDANPTFTGTSTGLVLGQTLAAVVPDLAFTTTATPGTGVGFHAITPTGTPSANYDVTFTPGTLQITKAPITLFALGNTTRLYGDDNPANYEVNVVGLKNGDTLAGGAIQFLAQTTANKLSPAGGYAVSIVATTSANYFIPPTALVNGTLTILPRPLTITADSFTRTYGDANPALTASFTGLASFDTVASAFPGLTISTPADQSSGVGSYGINIFGANSSNYDVTVVGGTLEITPAPLTFIANNLEVTYGEDLAGLLSATYESGLKGTDSFESLGITADIGGATNVGTYDLTVRLANANYFVPAGSAGTITILPRPIVITVDDAQRYFGDPLNTFNSAITSTLGAVDPLDQIYRIVDPTTIRSDVGIFQIGVELINPNYELVSVSPGLLRVLPRPIAIKPVNTGFTFGDDFTGVDYLVGQAGLAPFHTIDDVVTDTIYTQYTAGQNFGFTYAYSLVDEANRALFLGSLITSLEGFGAGITPGGYQTIAVLSDAALGNYFITSVPGAVSVVPRPVTLTIDSLSTVRNQPLPTAFSGSATNLAAADQGKPLSALFPELIYEIVPISYGTESQDTVSLSAVPLAPALTDADFNARYVTPPPPLPPAGGSVDVAPGGGGDGQVLDIVISPTDPSGDGTQVISINPGDTVTVTGTTVVLSDDSGTKEEGTLVSTAVDPRLVDQLFSIRARYFTNDNYVVTGVTPGTLTVTPDPEEVAAIEASTRLNTIRRQFFNPNIISGNRRYELPYAMGFNEDTIGAAVGILRWAMGDPTIRDHVLFFGQQMAGLEGLSEADLMIAFLSDLHTNAEKQAYFAGIVRDYTLAVMTGQVTQMSDTQRAYMAQFTGHLKDTKRELAEAVKARELAWHASKDKKPDSMVMTLLQGDVPYADIMTDAITDVVAENITGLMQRNEEANALAGVIGVSSGLVAGGYTVAGAVAGGTALAEAIFVNNVGITMSLSSTGVATAGAASGIALGVAIAVTRGIQIGKMADQQAFMESLTENPEDRPLTLTPEYDELFGGQTNAVEQKIDMALFNTALLKMFSTLPSPPST